MTPDDEKASQAHDFLHALITPLITRDPTGIGIKVNDSQVILLASERNMGVLIGKAGTMVSALRQLMKPFGWKLQIASQTRDDLFTPPIQPRPDIRTLVIGWLDARYGPEAYRLTGEESDNIWEIYIHPQHYDEADFGAIDTWAYCAARSQDEYFKVRLIPGGVIREPASA